MLQAALGDLCQNSSNCMKRTIATGRSKYDRREWRRKQHFYLHCMHFFWWFFHPYFFIGTQVISQGVWILWIQNLHNPFFLVSVIILELWLRRPDISSVTWSWEMTSNIRSHPSCAFPHLHQTMAQTRLTISIMSHDLAFTFSLSHSWDSFKLSLVDIDCTRQQVTCWVNVSETFPYSNRETEWSRMGKKAMEAGTISDLLTTWRSWLPSSNRWWD